MAFSPPKLMRPLLLACLLCCAVLSLPILARAEDKPLTEAGGPSLDRTWTGDDYSLVADLIAAHTIPLPVYADPQGKQFLQRILSMDNLAACLDAKTPLTARMDNFGKVLGGVSKILDQYQTEANKGMEVHTEAAQLSAYALRTVGVGVQLIDEMMPTVPKDEAYNVHMDGIKKYQAGLISIFMNVETSLAQRDFFRARDLTVLLDAMTETLPKVIRAIPADYRKKLAEKLEADKGMFPGEHDTKNIQAMLDLLKPAQAPSATPPS